MDQVRDMDPKERRLFLQETKRDARGGRPMLSDYRLAVKIFSRFGPDGRTRADNIPFNEVCVGWDGEVGDSPFPDRLLYRAGSGHGQLFICATRCWTYGQTANVALCGCGFSGGLSLVASGWPPKAVPRQMARQAKIF